MKRHNHFHTNQAYAEYSLLKQPPNWWLAHQAH